MINVLINNIIDFATVTVNLENELYFRLLFPKEYL